MFPVYVVSKRPTNLLELYTASLTNSTHKKKATARERHSENNSLFLKIKPKDVI